MLKLFLSMRFTDGWNSRSGSLGFVIEVFHSFPNQTNNPRDFVHGNLLDPKLSKRIQKPTDVSIHHDKSDLNRIDHVSKTRVSLELVRCCFEDNEAVIKMIIKG